MVKKWKERKPEARPAARVQQSLPSEEDFPELGSPASRPTPVAPSQPSRAGPISFTAQDFLSSTESESRAGSSSSAAQELLSSTESEPRGGSSISAAQEFLSSTEFEPRAGSSSGVSEGYSKPYRIASDTPKQSKAELQSLAQDVKQTLLVMAPPPLKRPFAKRPNFLTEGRPVTLLTNHFLLRVGKKQAFHYDINIEAMPKNVISDPNIVDKVVEESTKRDKNTKYARKIATKVNRKIFEKMIESYSGSGQVFNGINPVYDGQKNMFTSKILEGTQIRGNSLCLKVDLDENQRTSTFFVNIKLAETNEVIDLNILNQYHNGVTCDDEVVKKSILFINTLLRHNSTMKMTPIGQSIFDSNVPGQEISRFVLLAYGHYSSVRNLMVGPTLNVDRSAACFYKPLKVDNLIESIINGNLSYLPILSDSDRNKIKKELAGLQVEAIHISYGATSGTYYRKYRVLGVSVKSAKDYKFAWIERDKSGKEVNHGQVSVAEYFQLKYKKTLKYPHLPCLEVGNPSNKVLLPLEMCRIVPHQRLRRSLTNEERSKMTTIAGSQSPKDRLKQSEQYVASQYHSGPVAQQNRPFLYEFGIDVSKELLEVESRIIEPPKLKYNDNKSVVPQNGEWDMHKTRSKFLRAASLQKWIIINLSFTRSLTNNIIESFADELISQAKEMGMNINNSSIIAKIEQFDPKTTFANIKNKIRQGFPGLQMILFITPLKSNPCSDDIYSEIKLLGDVEKGFATQCVNVESIWGGRGRKWNRSYLRQLMLKINPKLGGTNVALSESTPSMPSIFKDKSLMIIGADVNHPAPADRITPSISAAVGSYDSEFCNYYTTVTMQPKSREEMIKNLDRMVIDLLTNYQSHKRSLPQKIIFYRDGVSDGQFQHVIDNEYSLLQKAFKHFGPKYMPKITFIIVQKKHHTRFIPKSVYYDRSTPKLQNISPGTVVEKSITHKTDFDFYLCSHEGRLGTSRAAHYHVLQDENGFNSNDMCKMTYYLCHIYARCTKSVSIPAPVYYADLAAYRAKVHASALQDDQLRSSSDVSSVTSGRSEEDERDVAHEENKCRTYEKLIDVLPDQKRRLYYC